MNKACELCQGACCDGVRMPRPKGVPDDVKEWAEAHGTVIGGFLYMPCRCKHLQNGLCSIYPDRFKVCKDMAVGGMTCRWAIAMNRKENATKIMSLL